MKKYSVEATGIDKPINVQIAIPSNWKESKSTPGSPVFTIPGLEDGRITLTAIGLPGTTEETMAKAIELQYGADAKDAQRADLPGGRVWMVRKERMFEHARVFVPFPGGVAMGFAMIEDEKGKFLPEIKKAFETLTIAQ